MTKFIVNLISLLFLAPMVSHAISINLQASRTSCVAPCGIFFDATGTTDQFLDPFTELDYVWDFGDPGATFQNRPGVDANAAKGAIASHVFDQPGAYNVQLTVDDNQGSQQISSILINVQDPDVVFSGSNTRCVSATGNFSGCPSGATQITSSDFDVYIDWAFDSTQKRVLYRRGDSFNSSGATYQTNVNGPILIGAYGTGADPLVTNVNHNSSFIYPNSGSNIAITSLHFQSTYDPATGLGPQVDGIRMNSGHNFITIYRNSFDGLALNLHLGQSDFFDDSVIADNFITKWHNYGSLTGDLMRVAFIGNVIRQSANATHNPDGKDDPDDPTIPAWADHGPIRIRNANRVLVSKNDMFNNVGWIGAPQPNIRFGTGGQADLSIISDNSFQGGSPILNAKTANDQAVASGGDNIWERNTLLAEPHTRMYFETRLGGHVIRNNRFIHPANGDSIRGLLRYPEVPNSTSENMTRVNKIYGNTYVSHANVTAGSILWLGQNAVQNFDIKNNIMYSANPTALIRSDQSGIPSGITSDNNILFGNSNTIYFASTGLDYTLSQWQANSGQDQSSLLSDPLFEDVSGNDFRLTSGSPARGAGTALLGLFEDYSGQSRSVTGNPNPDLGAFQFGSAPPPSATRKYWVGGSGNWSDANNWSDSSGGAGGVGAPSFGIDAIFDNNSGASTITLDQNVNVRDIHVSSAAGFSASPNLTINFNGRTLSASRDALFETGRIDQGGPGSVLSVGRNLNTARCDTSTREGTLSIHMIGTGHWRYTLGRDDAPAHLENPIIYNFIAAQNNHTTTLRPVGDTPNGYDIDVNNQLRMGNATGLLTMDLTEATGLGIVTIEIQNNDDTLDIVSSGARYAITKIEHEPPNGNNGQLQSNVVFQNLDVYDITGTFGIPLGSTPTWTMTGDMNLGSAILSIEKSAILDMDGHDLQVGSVNLGAGSTGIGQLMVRNGSLTIAGQLNMGSDSTRTGRLHLNNGYVSAQSLWSDEGINLITGDDHGVLELTGPVPTIAADIFYVAENGSDLNDGTSPGSALQTFEHALTKLNDQWDQILFRRGDQFDIPDALLIDLPGGTMGAFGSGPRPIISMAQPGSISLTGDTWRMYDLRFEFGDQSGNTPPSANAGVDQIVQLQNGQSSVAVTLDGSASIDPDGSIVAYRWTGTPDPNNVEQPVVNLAEGTYQFSLEIEDNNGQIDSDQVQIIVQPGGDPPPPTNDNADSAIGMNLAWLQSNSSQWAFKDVVIQANQFEANTGSLTLDPRGFPTSLQSGQEARTHVFQSINSNYPSGNYTLFYGGEGQIEIESTVVPNGGTINITPDSNGIEITIVNTDPNSNGNYVRDIRLIMPGTENGQPFTQNYLSQPFHPLFLDRLKHFKTIRFMDWLKTNGSHNVDPSHLKRFDQATQGGHRGVAPEYLAMLCNAISADAWINIPHQANDDYVLEFAQRIKDTLNSNLKVYVEYSNEVWNFGFDQAIYAADMGEAENLSPDRGTAGLRYYSQRSVEIFNRFEEIFGSNNDQVINVLGTQNASSSRSETILDWQNAYQHADVLAVAPYFSTRHLSADDLFSMTSQEIFDYLSRFISEDNPDPQIPQENFIRRTLEEQFDVANTRGLRLVAYEGGQALVGITEEDQNNQALTDLFFSINRDSRMEALYNEYLDVWRNAGGTDFVAFNFVKQPNQFGSWGALEYQDQDIQTAPKYLALVDYAQNAGRWWEGSSGNIPPISNAGSNQIIQLQQGQLIVQVQLDGGQSTDNGSIVAYRWSGNPNPSDVVSPLVTLSEGIYTFTLEVEDNQGATDQDTVQITVNPAPPPSNTDPIADAGPDQFINLSQGQTNVTVQLNGSDSTDVEGPIAVYRWSGNPNPADEAQPVVPLSEGVYQFFLEVEDSQGATDTDSVTITVSAAPDPNVNQNPISNAGSNQTITLNTGQQNVQVQLDGTDSFDPDGSISIYRWTGTPNPVNVSQPTVTLTEGTYQFTLEVEDNEGAVSNSDQVTITIEAPLNVAPTVNAGQDAEITFPDSLSLNGSVTDDNLPNGTLIILWSQVSGPGEVTFISPNSENGQVLFSEPGVYTLRLVADDGQLGSFDEITVTVNAAQAQTTPEFRNILSAESGSQAIIDCASTVDIYDRLGNLVISLPCGADFVTWDGRNNSGANVSSGIYILIERGKSNRKVVVIR